jgi:hypothetical protein
MKPIVRFAVMLTVLAITAACGELFTGTNRNNLQSSALLSAAFNTVPTGFSFTENSFDAAAAPTGPWFPGAPLGGMGREGGPGLGGGFGPMCGGGLGGDFLGGPGLGIGFGHGRLGDPALTGNCTFVTATGRVTCDPVTENGLVINRSAAYTTASGTAQTAFDSVTTNTINTRIQVSGTITRRDSATSVVTNSSDRTIGGLAKGSTQHTVDGTAAGHEVTTGKDSAGTFTAVRDATDTTRGIIVPLSDAGHAYPTAGTIIRAMAASITYAGQAAKTSTRREVVTYNGTNTAQLVITQDGTTRTCTLPLPFGRPTCQ